MKTILVFCPLYAPLIGGLESHADEFNKYLSRFGYKITVFTPLLVVNSLEQEIVYKDIEIIRFPAFELIPNWPLPKFWQKHFWDLYFSLYKRNYDVIISRTRFFITSLMALFFAKSKRVRWIHIEHGSDFVKLHNIFSTFLAWIYDQIFGRLVFKSSDLNISISKAVNQFVYRFDKRKSPVIYRGLEINQIDKIKMNNNIMEKYKNKTIITFTGRLFMWKGVVNTIRAIKVLPKRYQDKLVFLVVGNGEDYNHLKKVIGNKGNIIKMMGSVNRNEAISILKSTDIYIHSAFPGGGLSTSLLEAMYCKCLVIATPNEGADEVIDKTRGILISKPDFKMIRDKIIEVMDNKEKYREFGFKAKKYIEENFRWEVLIKKYLKVLERC
jgi:glycosyltransferase involved in cell wall biosynthesis